MKNLFNYKSIFKILSKGRVGLLVSAFLAGISTQAIAAPTGGTVTSGSGTADMSDSSKDAQFEQRTLQDAGIGYYLNHKDMFAKVEYARTIGSKIQTEHIGDDSRVILQAGWVF